jgi:heme A synthase
MMVTRKIVGKFSLGPNTAMTVLIDLSFTHRFLARFIVLFILGLALVNNLVR